MAITTTYGATLGVAYAGMISNLEVTNVISRTVTTAAIGFGKVGVQGAGDRTARLPDAANTKFEGIAVRDQGVPATATSFDEYPVGYTGGFLTLGVIWVVAGEAVARGDAAYFVPATGAIVKTATGNTPIPNAKFDASAASGALVPLRLA